MRRLAGLLIVLVLVLVTGCQVASDTPEGPGAGPTSPAGFEAGPVGLINMWRVSGAEGEDRDTWLRIDLKELRLWRSPGDCSPWASWAASESALVTKVYGGSGDCGAPALAASWLEASVGYRSTSAGWELVDGAGEVTAVLTIDGTPPPNDNTAAAYFQPPEITDKVREALQTPAPLPENAQPIGRDELLGRWVPFGQALPTDPFIDFHSDGTYEMTDGCNEGSGRWLVVEDGRLLATTGPHTLIGCEGAPVHEWMDAAASAQIDSDALVLRDRSGSEIARLVRS